MRFNVLGQSPVQDIQFRARTLRWFCARTFFCPQVRHSHGHFRHCAPSNYPWGYSGGFEYYPVRVLEVVAWTIPTRPEPIQAVYRLSDAEIRWISGSRSPMVVTADSSSGATMITTADLTDNGIAVLFEQCGTRGFTADQFPRADRFALVGGVVYGASDSGVTAIDATSGRVTGTSPSAAPTAVTSNGVALAQSSDGYTAFKVIPHF